MTDDLPSFQRYQQEFCAYLRDPTRQPKPKNVPDERIAVYEEIVFNNIFESVSACFPVTQQVLGKTAWLKLAQDFMRGHSADSPMFREIPEEFLGFLAGKTKDDASELPPYLANLCHYEWIELLVSSLAGPTNTPTINPRGDLLTHRPAFTPSLQLLNYDYAVHKISIDYKPEEKISTQLLVYCNVEDAVKFTELNFMTFRLIELLVTRPLTGEQALTMLADELNYPDPETLMQFGWEALEALRSQGIILGVYE